MLLSLFGIALLLGFAAEPITLDVATNPEALRARIEKAQETIERYGVGHVIVGRVLLDGAGDPRDVTAQMEILQDGFFAGETRDLFRPVGFRMHGHAPYDLELKGRTGVVVDVGTIYMKELSKDALLTLKGRVELEGQENADGVAMRLSVRNGPVNTPHNGISPRPRWPAPVMVEINDDGTFLAGGFSAIEYYCTIEAPGFVQKAFAIAFELDQNHDVGTVRLVRPVEIELAYVVADKPPFDPSQVRKAVLSGGDRWKATPDIYGWDLEFKQEKGVVLFDYSYAPCYLIDLGVGSLKEFIQKASEVNPQTQPRKQKVQNGHVYLMNQAHWNRWVLFEVRIK